MKIKLFEEFAQDRDYDVILKRMKYEHGWGDFQPIYIEYFEDSDFFDDSFDEDEYVENFNTYMFKIQTGEIDEPEFKF